MLSNVNMSGGMGKLLATLLLPGLLVASCKVDEQYSIDNVKDIDTDVTLFSENGLDVPLGSSDKIVVDSLMSKLNESARKFIEKNGDSYLLKTSGKFSLDEELKKLDMASLAGINGVNINEPVEYNLDFNKDDFKIDAVEHNETIKISSDEIIDFGKQTIDFNTSFTANVAKYAPSEEKLNLSPVPITQNLQLIPAGEKNALGTALLMLAGGDQNKEISIPSELLQSEFTFSDIEASVDAVNISLDEVITKIEDVKLDPDAGIDIDLSLPDCILSEGSVTAEINVDLSKIFKIEGQGVLALNENLSKSNGYHKAVSKKITELVYSTDGNSLSVTPQAKLGGKVRIEGAKTSYKTFMDTKDKDFALALTISYKGLKVADATLTLNEISIDNIEPAKHSLSFSCTAKDLKKVNYVFLDAPLSMKLELDKTIGSLSVNPALSIKVPQGMGFKYGGTETSDGGTVQILDGSRQLSPASPITEIINITSINPTVEGTTVSYDGQMEIQPSATVSGKLKLSDLINPDSKFALSAKIGGVASVSDYSVDINNMNVNSPAITQYVSAELKSGAGEFGSFTVIPSGNPKLQMIFKLPEIEGVNIVAGASGFTLQLPKMLVPVESDVQGYHFDSATNSIRVLENEVFPRQMSFGVKQLDLKPEKVGDDKYQVKDSLKVYGELAIGSTTITKDMIELVNKEESNIYVGLQSIKADKVILSGDLSFDLSTEKEITILKAKDLPSEIKYVKELTLSDVYAKIAASFTNLPNIGKDFRIDAKISLPSFINPSEIELKGSIKNNKFITEQGEAEFKVKIDKLTDIDLSQQKDILGTIKVDGKILASSPEISIESLKDKIACTLSIALGDKEGKVKIGRAVGKVTVDIPGHFAVNLSDLPEELKADDVILDLASPEIRMAISTNLGIPIAGNMTITPWRKGAAMTGNAVTLGTMELPYSNSAEVIESKDFTYNEPSMKNLIRQIPDSLVIDLNAGVVEEKDCIIEPAAKYKADIDYQLALPIELGSETNVSLHSDFELGEIAGYLIGNEIGITGKVHNGTPLVLKAKLNVVDAGGNVISGAVKGDKEIVIDGQKDSELEFYLNIPERYSAADVKSGSIILTIGSVGGAIRPSDYVQITELAAHIPEGITIKTSSK